MEVVATAGHVDHGKSALLQRLTGMEPDRFEEERRRGLTIDLGFVWTDVDGPDGAPTTVAFVDVPGHEDFLPNMLCGVGVVEQVLFVVAADDGWAAQSEEHLQIVELLGARVVLAVVTKADLAGPARTEQVLAEVTDRLAASSMGEVPVLAADSRTGTGLAGVRTVLGRRLGRSAPPVEAAARLWVDRAFTVRGAGTVVTGMLASGRLGVGEGLTLLPGGLAGRVRGLQCQGRDVETAEAGSRVAVNLSGIRHEHLARGTALVGPGADGAPGGLATTRLDVQLRALPHAPIGTRGAWHLHLGTAATTARVRPLLGEVPPGASGPARLELDAPVPARVGDRFVLREAGRRVTAGGGDVLDPDPARRPRGQERRLAHALVLEELAEADADGPRLAALVAAHGGARERTRLHAALGAARPVGPGAGPSTPDVAADADAGAGAPVHLGDHLVDRSRLASWVDAVVAAADPGPEAHAVPADRLATGAAAAGCPEALAGAVVERATADGRLRRYGSRFVARDRDAAYLEARGRREAALLDVLAATPWDPPDPAEAARRAGIPSFEVQRLVDEGTLVACGPLLFTAEAVAAAVRRLQEGPGRDGAAFTAAEARTAWGNTRRCAVPLLEHLRAAGVTRFDGRHHTLTSDPATR